jgi:FkbM family methyltransferase
MILTKQIEPFLKNLKGAIHVGANIGEERDWYKMHGMNRVLWFEPNDEIFPILLTNIKDSLENKAFNIGIHDVFTQAVLHIASNKGQSSSILELGTHAIHHPDVTHIRDKNIELIRLDTFFKKEKIKITDYNFLNIDVEGVELNVLKSFGTMIRLMDYIYVEVHIGEVYKKNSLLADVDKYLETFHFMRIQTKITKANWGDAFYIKERSL